MKGEKRCRIKWLSKWRGTSLCAICRVAGKISPILRRIRNNVGWGGKTRKGFIGQPCAGGRVVFVSHLVWSGMDSHGTLRTQRLTARLC